MADEKISAMTSATVMSNLDVVPIVQGGANKKVEKAIFLKTGTSESVAFVGPTTEFVGILASGVASVNAPSGAELYTILGFGVVCTPAGGVTIGAFTGQTVQITSNGGTVQLDGSGIITLQCAGGASVFASYTPLTPASWAGNPSNLATAIDRIAASVAFMLGSPIP